MKLLSLIIILLSFSGCSSTEANAKALLDRLEFGEDEEGCIRLEAQIDLNPFPLVTSNASLTYKKQKGTSNLSC